MTSAKIIKDVVNTNTGDRWTCFHIKFPRFILAEINTHRMLSKVSASSRAIPVEKMLSKVEEDLFYPAFTKNKKGMQSNEFVKSNNPNIIWEKAADKAVASAKFLLAEGIHKQNANRLLEPFIYHECLIAGTDWGNFFALRAHPDAQPEFQELAYKMLDKYLKGEFLEHVSEGWHGPFSDKIPEDKFTSLEKINIISARVARMSYANFNGEINFQDDLRLADKLSSSCHMSPFEFVVSPLKTAERHGNLRGFIQARKAMFVNENKYSPDLQMIMESKPDWIKL